MTTSLIITTYNWPKALRVVFESILKQTVLPLEIIIADDGSGKETKRLIEVYKDKFSIPLIHSWQEDNGFRAAESRNKAIAKANGKYIILIDGDMILHKNFIKDHINHAKKGYFIQGGRVILSKELSQEILDFNIIDFSFFHKNIKNRKNMINNKFLSKLFSYEKNNIKGIRTCNMSFFKKDCIDINGFDNNFIGWGREDSEFIVRLLNNNIKRKNIKFNCTAYHIWHNENSRKSLKENDDILKNSIKNKVIFCNNGIAKFRKGNNEE
jgi:glycosyltransferase involved in cell wall biosynthesis